MAAHKNFSLATDAKVYSATHTALGSVARTRIPMGCCVKYFPKGTDLSGYSQAQLDKVALKLNQRPRETLGFQTPADTLSTYVASIH